MSNPKRERWIEQRDMLRDVMAKALADNKMSKYHQLNVKLQKLNGRIRKEKQ